MSRAKRDIRWKALVVAAVAFLALPQTVRATETIEETIDAVAAIDTVETVEPDTLDEFALTPDSVLLRREADPRSYAGKLSSRDSAALHLADTLASQALNYLKPPFKPDPTRALWLGLILPDGGQIYNHKYWKLPIIYGGFLGCVYALSWNNQMLSDYSQAYLDIMDDDPGTKSYEKMLPMGYDISGREDQFKEIFKNRKNYYRKYRDMSILAFIAVYALSVIDAYVDAELSSFDISEDLSMHVQPAIIDTSVGRAHHHPSLRGGGQAVGMTFGINF